jgi:hypothetical protein
MKRLPKGLLKKTYPNWSDNQEINYWWSGDINGGPDTPNLISLADHPYLPTSIFGNQNPVNQPQPLNNPLVEVNEDLFADEDGFQTPLSLLQPPTLKGATGTRRGSRPGSRSTSPPGRSLGYELAKVQPELGAVKF